MHMNAVKQLFAMYGGLKKEIYILCFGRIVTSMGSLIWPMLTLILKNKLGFDASQIGLYMMVLSFIMIPCNLLGGKLADRYNKKTMIVILDLLGVACFLVCGFMELSIMTILIYALGSIFQQMEGPSFDSLIADLTSADEREKAYSLSYLSMNLGLVLAPTMGGLLFENHLGLAFIISGLADFSSTILIFFLVKDIKKETNDEEGIYEKKESGALWKVLLKRKILLFYFLIASISGLIYAQFNFLIPLHLEDAFLEKGALYFGFLTSVNAIVVIFGTPVLTRIFLNWKDISRLYLGNFLEIFALSFYIFIYDQFYLCVISMILFTFGEIICTISSAPYLTKRIPSTHRGRILSLQNITSMVIGSLGNVTVGSLVDAYSIHFVWILILLLGILFLIIFYFYQKWDKRSYQQLY